MAVHTEKVDVVVLGGGPAGAAAALTLRRHAPEFSVTLVERSDYSAFRVGETLPPVIEPVFRRLGVWEAFLAQEHEEAMGTSSTWENDSVAEYPFLFSPNNRGWHLDRVAFDRMLVQEAEKQGVSILIDAKLSEQSPGESGTLLSIQGRKTIRLDASFVVDATGRQAVFALRQGARRILFDQLVGSMRVFDVSPDGDGVDSYTHVEPAEYGWWYSAIVPGGKLVVACMTDGDLCQKLRLHEEKGWDDHAGQTNETRLRIERAVEGGPLKVRPANTHRLDRFHGDGWIAAGDAATAFDPLSGQGILKALRSGAFAAYAVGDYLRGVEGSLENYRAGVSQEFEAYLETHEEFYLKEQRWREAPFWQRRHRAIRLGPHGLLRRAHSSGRTPDFPAEFLSRENYEQIYTLCRKDQTAAVVVSALKLNNEEGISDKRIILGLQRLIEIGILELVA